MIQDVELACSASMWKCCNETILEKNQSMWVWNGVWSQVVWPMMIVTATNYEGFTRLQFAKMLILHHLSPSCGHTPFHTHINLKKDRFVAAFQYKSQVRMHTC